MEVGVLGINYKSSQIELRESFAKACNRFLERRASLPCVLLSTCNRTEIYFSAENLSEMHSHLLLELKAEKAFEEKLYSYFGEKCFCHLAGVTAGVDSVLFGEAEIQGQVKTAYTRSLLTRSLSSAMHYLFQKSLKIGKEIRTEFSLPKGSVSLESTIWELACCFFPEKKPISLLLIGYSEINRKILAFLKGKEGLVDVHLTTRNHTVGEEMQKKHNIHFVPWGSLAEWSQFSMIISGSKVSDYLLLAEQIPLDPLLIKTRLLIDLGLPRTVDPQIAKNPLITLFNIEEIGDFIDKRQRVSLQEQLAIRRKIEESVMKQMALYVKKKAVSFACV